MLKKISKIIFTTIIFTIISFPINAYAKSQTLNDLIEKGETFDKKEVRVNGEAIGEMLNRKDYSWININDTSNAMGIYMKKEDGLKIKMYGGYKQKGDTIEVVGTFNRACKEHGGDMDIHAKKVKIIEEGEVFQSYLPKEKVVVAIVTTVLALLLGYILYKKMK